ncbi:MAG TPA: hypothetical protein VMW26_03050 [Methanomassiliicoccales archaeon]|nr:hypothetical protein [Methanomassiliicoccales archaeon]
MDGYYQAMKTRGFSENTMKSIRRMKCPVCGFEFSLVYARTFACAGCSNAIAGCPKVRCAKCDHEFYIEEIPEVNGKRAARSLADHISDIVEDYNESYGLKKNR